MTAEVAEMDVRLNGLGSDGQHSNANHQTHVNGNSDLHIAGSSFTSEHDEEMDVEAGQISPSSRRRSTRACALKAAEKIKHKEDYEDPSKNGQPAPIEEYEEENGEELEGNPQKKKRRLADGKELDQFCPTFSIQLYNDRVYAYDCGSEISSLNEVEIDKMRKSYEKMITRVPDQEQLDERNRHLRQAEAELRLEEAKLMMLNKIVKSVQDPHKTQGFLQNSVAQKNCAGSGQCKNSGKGSGSSSSSTSSSKNAGLATLANLTPAQQQELARKAMQLDQSQLKKLMDALQQNQNPALQQIIKATQQQLASTSTSSSTNASTSSATPSTSQATTSSFGLPNTQANAAANALLNPLAAQTPQQRAAAARHAFRRQADQQLSQLANPPKAPHHEIGFIPNTTTSEFTFLLGLDLVVQRIQKDERVDSKPEVEPYACEECGSDYTPVWRAIGSPEDNLHLYCYDCVHEATKRKNRNDHTANMKKIFSKFEAQEKDFEKQIADGKLEAALAEAAKAAAAQQAAAQAAARPNRTNTPQPVKSSTPAPIVPKQTISHASSSTSTSKNRSSNSSSVNAQMQAQFAAIQQLMARNPMMTTMMANPQAVQQMMHSNPMFLALHNQVAQAARLGNLQQAAAAAGSNSMAMNLLAQAVQNAQGVASTTASATSGLTQSQQAAMAALQALANPASTSSALSSASSLNPFAAAFSNSAAFSAINPQLMQKFAAQYGASLKKK